MEKIRKKGVSFVIVLMMVVAVFPLLSVGAEDYYCEFEIQAGETQVTLKGLTDTWNITWSGNSSAATGPVPVQTFCNSSGIYNETMEVNLTVNVTHPIEWINVSVGNLKNLSNGWLHNASNITLLISGDNATWQVLQYDVGYGNGVFPDGGGNLTINESIWGVFTANPWTYHGDAGIITNNCSIYLRYRCDLTMGMNYGYYWNESAWTVYIGEDFDTIDYENFNGQLRNGFEPMEGCCLDANKTVWNGSAWVKHYNTSSVGEEVRFNISFHNCGETLDYNISIFETYYDALTYYVPGSGTIKYPNQAVVNITPFSNTWENATCEYPGHGHMTWHIAKENLTNFTYCNYIYLEFNLTVNSSNYSKNEVGVYVCPTAYDWWDSDCYNKSECYVNEEFNTLITCPSLNPEASNWTISEHINRPCTDGNCYDEEWFDYETEFDRWCAYNASDTWEWVYRYDNLDGNGTDSLGLSYTIANNSDVNRSMSILRTRYNITNYEEEMVEPCVGLIYAFSSNTDYDMVLYGYDETYLLSKRGNQLVNTNDSSVVTDKSNAYNYYSSAWPKNTSVTPYDIDPETTFDSWKGIWIKTLYNGLSGLLQTKAWQINNTQNFSLDYEIPGWIYDDYINNISSQITHGIAGCTDSLPYSNVIDVYTVRQGVVTYSEALDYIVSGDSIDWLPGGIEPAPGSTYNVDYKITSTNANSSFCFGLVVWNPDDTTNFTADFDFIEEWRLNYSRDEQATASQIENHSIFGTDGIPLINFPVYSYFPTHMDMLDDYYYNCYHEYDIGNITLQQYGDCTACYYQNLSRLFNMESRQFDKQVITAPNEEDQKDNIYYYTSVMTNLTCEFPYNNSVYIQIEECTDGSEDSWDGAVVCIDVDNNQVWDDNDMAFYWYTSGTDVWYSVYNGTASKYYNKTSEFVPGMEIWFDIEYTNSTYDWYTEMSSLYPAVHRYSPHRVYNIMIPIYYFEKGSVGSENYLNANDTFGLHIMTTDNDYKCSPVWENWNESNESTYTPNGNDANATWSNYMNCTSWDECVEFEEGIWNGVTATQMQYWGHGKIGNNSGYLVESLYRINATKEANESTIANIGDDNLVNYTITVCNSGDNPVTNITVNDTLPSNVEYVSSSLPSANVTNPSGNTYIFNVTTLLPTFSCVSFDITVNFSADCYMNGTNVVNDITVTTTEKANTSANDTIKYGTNNAPVITAHYPIFDRDGTPLLLTGINVTVEDADADLMNVSFYTNKTELWPPTGTVWHGIGVNSSVNNGTFSCNQSFENTMWYWGDTSYYWWINVSDGKTWTNESYLFISNDVRFDVNYNYIVNVQDVSYVVSHYTASYATGGIYDVNGNGLINVQDVSYVVANYT